MFPDAQSSQYSDCQAPSYVAGRWAAMMSPAPDFVRCPSGEGKMFAIETGHKRANNSREEGGEVCGLDNNNNKERQETRIKQRGLSVENDGLDYLVRLPCTAETSQHCPEEGEASLLCPSEVDVSKIQNTYMDQKIR